MDARLRDLERRYNADSSNIELAQQLIAAYRRTSKRIDARKRDSRYALTVDDVVAACEELGIDVKQPATLNSLGFAAFDSAPTNVWVWNGIVGDHDKEPIIAISIPQGSELDAFDGEDLIELANLLDLPLNRFGICSTQFSYGLPRHTISCCVVYIFKSSRRKAYKAALPGSPLYSGQ